MELKPNMYVRTYKGIRKIVEVVEDNNYYIDKTYINDFRQEINCITDSCIIGKPSYNIIDLIKVGDYVNGELVLEKVLYGNNAGVKVFGDIYYSEDIKSIVTKECFESMSYKVGD